MLFNATPRRSFIALFPQWTSVAFTQLVSYGVHLGHSILNTLNSCAWMVKGRRKGIFLIDLFKFVYMFRAGLFVLDKAIRGRNPVWFINLNKLSSLFVKFPALECGEYWVVENWIRGMISNYFVIRKSFLKTVNKPFPSWNRKAHLKNANFTHWGFTRNTWPRLIFVSNVLRSYGPCHEAHRLQIPTLGITDTDTPHNLVSIAVPANDEGASALAFYNTLVSNFVLYIKYAFVQHWYMGSLNESVFSFENWWGAMPRRRRSHKFSFAPNLLSFKFDHLRYMVSAFETQFLQDLGQGKQREGFRFLKHAKHHAFSSAAVLDYFKGRVRLLKTLSKAWTLATFGFALVRPRFRRWHLRQNIQRRRRNSLLITGNLNFLLRPPRISRFFMRRVARRLYRSRSSSRVRRFFFKFFGLSTIFSLLRHNSFFSDRFSAWLNPKAYYHRGGVRVPWFKFTREQRRALPLSFRKIYVRNPPWRYYRPAWHYFAFDKTPAELLNGGKALAYSAAKGFTRLLHQMPKEWSKKGFFLARYLVSLGFKKASPSAWKTQAKTASLRAHKTNRLLVALPTALAGACLQGRRLRRSVPSFLWPVLSTFTFFAKQKPLARWAFSRNPSLKSLLFKRAKKRYAWGQARVKYPFSLAHFSFSYNYVFYRKYSKIRVSLARRSSKRARRRFLRSVTLFPLTSRKQRWLNYV